MRLSTPLYLSLIFTISTAFTPSNEWQAIPDDEEIPPGLHVRLDMQSGLRQAKLVEPAESVPQASGQYHDINNQDNKAVVVQAPPSLIDPQDSEDTVLNNAVRALQARTVTDQQLDNLADLAHDREFGSEITDKVGAHLLEIILSSHSLKSTKEAAARVFGASLRNNPTALQSVFIQDQGIVPKVLSALSKESDGKIASRLIYVLSSLMGQVDGMKSFVQHNGGDALAAAYNLGVDAKLKCSNFVEDYLLNNPDYDFSVNWKVKELQRWADLFQQDLISTALPARYKLKLLEALASIKNSANTGVLVSDKFMSWISAEAIKSADKLVEEDEKDLNAYIKEVRHLVFGNPKAARKQFDDL